MGAKGGAGRQGMAGGGGAGRGMAAKVPPNEGKGAARVVGECAQESVQAACEELKPEQNDVCFLWRSGGAAQAGGGSRAGGWMGKAATVDSVLGQIVLVVAKSPLGAR